MARIARETQTLRAAHPETLTVADYTRMRAELITLMDATRELLAATAEFVEVAHEHDNSRR